MELIRGLHNFAPRHRGSVVSIGNFDGLHRGHQALITRLRVLAAEHRLPATVVCFEPMPREFFLGAAAPPRIADLRGKLRDLEMFGVDRVVVLPFGARLAAMSAAAFVQTVLIDGLGARAVIVGDDFRYGQKRAGDLTLLQAMGAVAGFTAEGLGTVEIEGERSSSTALRAALAQPDLDKVERLLDRRYRIVGRVRQRPSAPAAGFGPRCLRGAAGLAGCTGRPAGGRQPWRSANPGLDCLPAGNPCLRCQA